MASADLREELKCSICLDLYTEPRSLKCGHSYCLDCIADVLDIQEETGVYSCPECREEHTERPTLEKNRKLCNIVECFKSAHQEETEVICTYCDPPVPASTSCLHCEASFCDKHLSNHSKAAHHILTKPTSSFGGKKCSTHQEILKYFCTEDSVCICMSCWVAGDHKGHQVELLNEASEKTKWNLRESKKALDSKRQEVERRIQNLENHRTEQTEKTDFSNGIAGLFIVLRKHLDYLEQKIQSETCRQKDQISQSVSDLIHKLEEQKDELSREIIQLEELQNIQDPLTFLKKVPNRVAIIPVKGETNNDLRKAGYLTVPIILQMLQKGLFTFAQTAKRQIDNSQTLSMEKTDILLDVNTAHDNLNISMKRKKVSHTDNTANRPDDPKRFQCSQVLSIQSFTSGTHYWEVDVSDAEEWLVGVAAESMERKICGNESFIGYNDKSWSLSQRSSGVHVRHKNTSTAIDSKSSIKIVGIHLEYEAGRLTFYQLCDPIRHLHTFTATFTQPLHAAFYVFPKTSIRILK